MLYYLYTDGGANDNPGPAGIGAVLYDENMQEIKTLAESLGKSTNNQAEYWALIKGLKMARKEKIKNIIIRLDSELLVKQIKGEYKVKNEQLKPLKELVDFLLEDFDNWQIEHIPREENKRADELSRLHR